MKVALHWFRRDLRITDNTALSAAAAEAEQVIPVYIRSDWHGSHRWTGAPRQEFLCGCLASLAANLESLGSRLVVRSGPADEALAHLVQETGAEAIFFNKDYDPFGRAMEDRLRARGLPVRAFKDSVIHEEHEVLTGNGEMFKVYTPYSNAWKKLPKPAATAKLTRISTPAGIESLPLPTLADWGLQSTAQILPSGESAARKRLQAFLAGPIFRYAAERDIPLGQTTSRLSADLRFGTLSIREIYHRAEALMAGASLEDRKGIGTFINELIWREFYMQILWHRPELLEQEFNPKYYRTLAWAEPGEAFERWKEGMTGFPIVDAGMRQLKATGWMHNRLRMIVAMFLTKDLHLDWRLGEQYFMQQLVDGEIASNNGGWQWSAGTGADAAPYFRIQNPWSQTKRFDPEGRYIKQWIPEIQNVPAAALMEPPKPGLRLAPGYPLPIVDHAVERDRALAMFQI